MRMLRLGTHLLSLFLPFFFLLDLLSLLSGFFSWLGSLEVRLGSRGLDSNSFFFFFTVWGWRKGTMGFGVWVFGRVRVVSIMRERETEREREREREVEDGSQDGDSFG
eukprot:TRINITY_DN18996_c0_g1_i1.p2 TRINITY_DN18996_c0_g1~~TRINITY_DN18996_c0_g1_i1.p2  ORF type:complete len:108 (-),score=17.94 TRINITY_DN18996_c0_g1_i1:860-1183(-)